MNFEIKWPEKLMINFFWPNDHILQCCHTGMPHCVYKTSHPTLYRHCANLSCYYLMLNAKPNMLSMGVPLDCQSKHKCIDYSP